MVDVLSRNNVNVLGRGDQVIVFGHGLACDQRVWNNIISDFTDDYKVVLYDYVGAGNSDLSFFNLDRYSSLSGYALDLMEILESLNVKDVIFVGHSVSAMVGVLASIKKPDLFSKLILVGSSPRYLNSADAYIGGFEQSDIDELIDLMEVNFNGWATLAASMFMNNPDRLALSENLSKAFKKEDAVIVKNFAEVVFLSDHRKDLPQVSVPSLIMQCSEDSIVPLETAKYLHKNLKGSELVVMKATGHYPQLSYPKETVEVIKDYLSK